MTSPNRPSRNLGTARNCSLTVCRYPGGDHAVERLVRASAVRPPGPDRGVGAVVHAFHAGRAVVRREDRQGRGSCRGTIAGRVCRAAPGCGRMMSAGSSSCVPANVGADDPVLKPDGTSGPLRSAGEGLQLPLPGRLERTRLRRWVAASLPFRLPDRPGGPPSGRIEAFAAVLGELLLEQIPARTRTADLRRAPPVSEPGVAGGRRRERPGREAAERVGRVRRLRRGQSPDRVERAESDAAPSRDQPACAPVGSRSRRPRPARLSSKYSVPPSFSPSSGSPCSKACGSRMATNSASSVRGVHAHRLGAPASGDRWSAGPSSRPRAAPRPGHAARTARKRPSPESRTRGGSRRPPTSVAAQA